MGNCLSLGELSLTVAQRFFGLFPGCDIGNHGQCSDVLPAVIQNWVSGKHSPDVSAIFVLKFKVVMFFDSLTAAFRVASCNFNLCLLHEFKHGFTHHFLDAVAQDLGHFGVHKAGFIVWINNPDALIGRFYNPSILSFTLAQRFFSQFAIGNIQHHANGTDHLSVSVVDPSSTICDPMLGAIRPDDTIFDGKVAFCCQG